MYRAERRRAQLVREQAEAEERLAQLQQKDRERAGSEIGIGLRVYEGGRDMQVVKHCEDLLRYLKTDVLIAMFEMVFQCMSNAYGCDQSQLTTARQWAKWIDVSAYRADPKAYVQRSDGLLQVGAIML